MGGDNLNLRDFVRSALLDVLGGIRDAQADQTLGRFIAPVGIGSVEFPSDGGVVHSQRLLVTTMKFDVAVTVVAEKAGQGGAKVGISVLSANLNGSLSSKSENASRIQFAVPLKFPRFDPNNSSGDGS